KLGCELKVPFELTYSCYAGGGRRGLIRGKGRTLIPVHCGVCENCVQRKKGFYWAGVEDVSTYKKSS
ncbi:MAG TPA: 7-cyano-7-deazaguanine synthase, partial [Candidatus Nanoarchaeia archaeon]|nr:7-cyano-7-deazaguanine synthase [Candidatus Nanoarchaeia archaeon]